MIYLDNNSTTRVDPQVVDAMLPFFSQEYGNAASTTHELGRSARQAVELSRAIIAQAIGATEGEIYFTSGATESNNLAIRGLCTHRGARHKRVVSSTAEHRAVLDPLKRLTKERIVVDWIDSDASGKLEQGSLVNQLAEPLDLVSLMLANNEIGNLLDVEPISSIKKQNPFVLHCDGAQALGKCEIDVQAAGIDMLSLSAHKVYGPKGVGALYVRRGVRLKPIVDGGGHENGKRSGTLNVPGIVGFAKAVELAQAGLQEESSRIRQLMHQFDSALHRSLDGVELNGPPLEQRLLGNLNYSLQGIDAETLTLQLPEICISTGSACTSADPEPSHVLQSLGLNETEARSSIRVGIGRFNTAAEIDHAVQQICTAVTALRGR